MNTMRRSPRSTAAWMLAVGVVWLRNFRKFRQVWMVSFFWIVLEPAFYLGGLGFGMGALIPSVGGVPYAQFFLPALMVNSAVLVAFFVGSYDGFAKLTLQNLYQSQLSTPLEPSEIALGEILWAASKGTLSALGVLLLGSAFGLVKSLLILFSLPIIFMVATVSAAAGMLVATKVQNFDQVIYATSGVLIPLTLFSGTYFPLDQLPNALSSLLWLSPISAAVSPVRDLLQGNFNWWMIPQILWLLGLMVILVRWAIRRLYLRLVL